MYVHYLDYGEGFMGVYKCHNIKLYTLNMDNLLYVNYTLISCLEHSMKGTEWYKDWDSCEVCLDAF